MSRTEFDVAVVGGGIVGLATAMALLKAGRGVAVLEAEDRVGAHQTGHNSGVIHSGLYYRPGSLKARLCVEGREAMFAFCRERGLPHARCGKVVVAARAEDLPRLAALEERGRANGLAGVKRLDAAELKAIEPHAAGLAALCVPETGVADYAAVAGAMAEAVRERGGEVLTGARVAAIRPAAGALTLECPRGAVRARFAVTCAGLQSDRVARLAGADPGLRIVPFRGEYWTLRTGADALVRALVYPVPDPAFPFLGVHFTRRIGGAVEAGPNAVLALRREGYARGSFSLRDARDIFGYSGFRRLAAAHWRMALAEEWRALSRRALARSLQILVPDVRAEDLVPGGSGVRAQALAPDGKLLDDFAFVEGERSLHVLNAPSPAATASIAIGKEIARRVRIR
ncbi:MAG: L-2-hydroxyglutarate oxidase [Planctomycetes bacterium]|nr:L-2-hydroxyglutarate oxidase [Planctomycetota bacterium]